MTDLSTIHEFPDREAASRAAAECLASAARKALDTFGAASLVLSGGTTPGRCLELLSNESLDWSKVTVLPSDERWVPADHPDSNERLMRKYLIQGRAARAKVLPLYRAGLAPSAAPAIVSREIAQLRRPFSGVLLGMGEDGHFASLFPDLEALDQALDPEGKARCVLVTTAASPLLRISLTLRPLLNAGERLLLCFGSSKRLVLQSALAGDPALPVAALLNQEQAPVSVFWAP